MALSISLIPSALIFMHHYLIIVKSKNIYPLLVRETCAVAQTFQFVHCRSTTENGHLSVVHTFDLAQSAIIRDSDNEHAEISTHLPN